MKELRKKWKWQKLGDEFDSRYADDTTVTSNFKGRMMLGVLSRTNTREVYDKLVDKTNLQIRGKINQRQTWKWKRFILMAIIGRKLEQDKMQTV